MCDSWIQRLGQTGRVQADALLELQDLLLKRLSVSFHSNTSVDSAFIEDIVQEALLKILNSLHQFEGRSKFATWATTIAIRTAYTELRRRHWKDVSLDQMVESQGEFLAIVDDESTQSEKRQGLVDAMLDLIDSKLTEKQRFALLAELQGWPMEEIGRRTKSNRNAIYKLTHDARKRLKRELNEAGFSDADYFEIQEATR